MSRSVTTPTMSPPAVTGKCRKLPSRIIRRAWASDASMSIECGNGVIKAITCGLRFIERLDHYTSCGPRRQRLTKHQHGDRAMGQYLLGLTAKKKRLNAASSVRSHHN